MFLGSVGHTYTLQLEDNYECHSTDRCSIPPPCFPDVSYSSQYLLTVTFTDIAPRVITTTLQTTSIQNNWAVCREGGLCGTTISSYRAKILTTDTFIRTITIPPESTPTIPATLEHRMCSCRWKKARIKRMVTGKTVYGSWPQFLPRFCYSGC